MDDDQFDEIEREDERLKQHDMHYENDKIEMMLEEIWMGLELDDDITDDLLLIEMIDDDEDLRIYEEQNIERL